MIPACLFSMIVTGFTDKYTQLPADGQEILSKFDLIGFRALLGPGAVAA
jgi:hypothetical protein